MRGGENMWERHKIMLHNITDKQDELLRKMIGAYRYFYNWGWYFRENYYKEHGHSPNLKKVVQPALSRLRYEEGNEWMLEINLETCRYALKDLYFAYDTFFKGINKFPRLKSKKKSKKSFKVRADCLAFYGENNRYVRIPGFGRDKDMLIDCKKHNIPVGKGIKYYDVRITFDGDNYWLSLSIQRQDNITTILTDENSTDPIGIDVGIRTSAYLSNGKKYDPPDAHRLAVLNNRISKIQSSSSRDITRRLAISKCTKTKYYNIPKSKNQLKREARIRKAYRDITNLYDSHYHKISREIANSMPKFVVIEGLQVESLKKKNKKKHNKINRSLGQASLGKFLSYIEYKCSENGIPVIRADSEFPSSQICSNCGYRNRINHKKTFICSSCGYSIDRDYNASINLLNYGYSLNGPMDLSFR